MLYYTLHNAILITGELMVIVELCRNGNLRDFLRNNRHNFINQLDDEGNLKSLSEKYQVFQTLHLTITLIKQNFS